MAFSVERLEEIITSSDFYLLLGEIESEWFECKGQPYPLDDDPGRRELAKDVSSFANHRGGYILIGVKTKTSHTHFGDEVEKIRTFEQSLVNTDQYQKIIRDWTYPEIEGVNIQWVAAKNDAGRGIVVIKIPPQKEHLKPFLIKKVLDEKKQVEIMFGYAERRRDNSQPKSVVDLQMALRAGLNYEDNLNARLENLEVLIRQATEHSLAHSAQENLTEEINKRVETAFEEGGLKAKRAMALTVYTIRPNEVESLFSSSESGVRKHLESPPDLRYGGWALRTDESLKIIRGELVRARSHGYKIIDLYRDGTLVFAVGAAGEFLAWATPDGEQKINSIALVEVVYNYASLYKLVLEDLRERPDRIFFRVDLRNLHLGGVKTYLPPYGADSSGFRDKYYAPDNDVMKVVEVDAKDFDAGKASFRLLRELYLWFGLEEDKIPYTKIEDGVQMVDPDQIKRL